MGKVHLRVFGILLAVAVLLALPQGLRAQAGTAMLSGVVTDPSGAGIPNATVVLQSADQHASRQTVTQSTGAYVIPAILPGDYQLRVSSNGFQSQRLTNITLLAGQGSTLNVVLKLASVSTSVEVRAAAPLLESTTATVGSALEAQAVTALPTLGRNFTSLILVLPSAVNITNDTGTSGVAGIGGLPVLYGMRPRYNNLTIDGLESIEPLFTYVGLYPPPDAIAEMKVETATDQGATGWVPAANISVVTKSGTNTYHADVWEFLQNNALNARSFFNPSVGPYKWNQFGFAGGGPLQIPHVLTKEKAWYIFGYYEGVRNHSTSFISNEVPSAAEMGGDFSADPAIYNPYTSIVNAQGVLVSRQQFPGNVIPTGTTNLCPPQPTCINASAYLIAKTLYPAPNLAPGVIPGANYLQVAPNVETADQWSARVDHQFGQKDTFYGRFSNWRDDLSAPTGLPALTFVSDRNDIDGVVSETHVFNPSTLLTVRFGVLRNNDPQLILGPPDLASSAGTLTSFPAWLGVYNIIPPISIAGYPGIYESPSIIGPEYNWQWSADIQKIKGRHTIAFGGDVMRTTFYNNCQGGTFVNFDTVPTSFGPGTTGDPLASYLLGIPSGASRVIGNTGGAMSANEFALYGQDTFHASRKLTVNLGLRWEVGLPMINSFGSATFEEETGQYLWDMKNPITGAPANVRRGIVATDWHEFSPRVGIAYQVKPSTVVRASGGIFFETAGDTYQWEQGNRGNWPFAFPQAVSENATIPTEFFPNPFPGPAQGSTTPLGCEQCLEAATNANRSPYIEEWTFSIQHAITKSVVAEAAYVGNHGVREGTQTIDDVAAYPGTNPYQDRQPWPSFSPFINNMYDEAMSWYEGVSLRLDWRASHNLTFLANYTYQKTLAQVDQGNDGGLFGEPTITPTRYDLSTGLFNGPAMYSLTNVANLSYIYQFRESSNSRLNAFIGGWEVSGTVSLDSGVPVYSVLSSDNENIGTSASGRITEFPDLVCNPLQGFTYSLSEAFNTSCYQLPAYGTPGYAGKHAIYGDSMGNWNAAIIKQWPFAENKSLEFRAEFFNFLNGHAFNPPNMIFGTPQFGTINSTLQNGRTIQFALKLSF
jgi:hypothetical protein